MKGERQLLRRIRTLEAEVAMLRARLQPPEPTAARFTPPDMERIVSEVAAHFRLSPDTLKSRSRTSNVAIPRLVAMALGRRLTGLSLLEIARSVGRTNAGTARHAVSAVKNLEELDPAIRAAIKPITAKLTDSGL